MPLHVTTFEQFDLFDLINAKGLTIHTRIRDIKDLQTSNVILLS